MNKLKTSGFGGHYGKCGVQFKTTTFYFIGNIDNDPEDLEVHIRHTIRHCNPVPENDYAEQIYQERPEIWEVYFGGHYHNEFKTEKKALKDAHALVTGSWRKPTRKK